MREQGPPIGFYRRQLQPRLLNARMGVRSTGEIRQRVCAGLAGEVLDIGYGSGSNQSFLPPEVSGVWVVDPSSMALDLSSDRRARSPVPVVVAGDDAERLQLPDDRFDDALSTWTLCAMADPLGLELTSLHTYYDAASPKPAGCFYEGRAAA